ncbi:ATP-binding protein [Flavobacterium sp.]|uniref:tetratricopeptide repeat-containing sensor histidine kinase n=1 Tax=Flavobacterium sp. TaxID=239 RepID=UPI0039E262D3
MGSKKIAFILLLIGFQCSFAQQVLNKDSLLRLLPKTKDKELVFLYIHIGQQYEGTSLDTAKNYYKKAEKLSKQLQFDEGLIKFIANYTYVLNIEGKLQEALELNLKSIKIAQKTKSPELLLSAYGNTAASYQYLENYNAAIQYSLQAIEYAKQLKDEVKLSTIYGNLSALYEDIGQNEKSIEYAILAEENARKNKLLHRLTNALINKSIALTNLGRFDEANKAIEESLHLSIQLENDYLKLMNLLNKGDVLLKSNQSQFIKPYAEEALLLSQKLENKDGEIFSYLGLSSYYLYKKDHANAHFYASLALEKAKVYESKELLQNCYKLMATVSMARNEVEKWHAYTMSSDSVKSIIDMEKTNKAIVEATTKYESEKKNLQIQNLESQNKKRLWISIALGLGIIGAGGIAFSLYKNYKAKKAILLLEQEKAVADERLRIAQDMHDDVGTGLSRIRYIVNAIKSDETIKEDRLDKVAEISDDTISKMSEIIWALNETNQTLEELIFFIRSQVSEMVENAKIKFIGTIPDAIPELSFGWMRNRHTFLLVKETVNNAIKHANANQISLSFEIKDNNLIITVSDNGKGFDTAQSFSGNGFRNYQKRIQSIGGTYAITSTIEEGTQLVYTIPLQ